MKVLVTGAAGFIGAEVVRQLLDEGHNVRGVDCFIPNLYPSSTKRNRLESIGLNNLFEFVEADLRIDDIQVLLTDVDVVINLAAMPGLAPSWTDFETYLGCNALVVQRLLDQITNYPNIHFIQISTSSVYGANAKGDENQPLNPVSPYGVTKLAGEQLVLAYRENFGISASILRYFSVYGPNQRPDMAYSIFCNNLINNIPVTITGSGKQIRSNTYVDDVARATIAAAKLRLDGEILNICGGEPISMIDALETISEALDIVPNIVNVEDRKGDQKITAGDSSRAKRLLGWEPKVSIKEGLTNQAITALQSRIGKI